MASSTPDQITADIERTQEDIREDIDALQEKVSPRAAAQRGAARVGDTVQRVRDSVMGTAQEGAERARSAAGDVRESVNEAPAALRARTRGNPLPVGLVAFAVGWMASSLIPASQPERRAVQQLKDSDPVQQAAQPLADSARQVAHRATEEATGAAQQVRDRATEVTQQVRRDATDPAGPRGTSGSGSPDPAPDGPAAGTYGAAGHVH